MNKIIFKGKDYYTYEHEDSKCPTQTDYTEKARAFKDFLENLGGIQIKGLQIPRRLTKEYVDWNSFTWFVESCGVIGTYFRQRMSIAGLGTEKSYTFIELQLWGPDEKIAQLEKIMSKEEKEEEVGKILYIQNYANKY